MLALFVGMSLHLASDNETTVQSHLDELSIRLGRVLAIFVLMMIFAWNWIDTLLSNYLSLLSPCLDCIAVYSPTEWVSLRWLTILLFGICLTLPFFFREVFVFSSPGMMSHERKWFKKLLFVGSFAISSIVLATSLIVLPTWFLAAEDAGFIEGVTPSYSAAAMLELALVICYLEIIVFLSIIAAILLRRYGIAEGDEKATWQLRLHGVAIFSMWLIVPSEQDTLLTLGILAEFIFVELSFSKINRGRYALPILKQDQGILDEEAKLRRIGIVDCSCAGACPKMGVDLLPKYLLGLESEALCLNHLERDMLIETVLVNKLTDVIIAGCSSNPLPDNFKNNLEYLDCNLRGMDLMNIETLREGESFNEGMQLQMSLASLSDPWLYEKRKERQKSVLNNFTEQKNKFRIISSEDEKTFGLTLAANEIYSLDS